MTLGQHSLRFSLGYFLVLTILILSTMWAVRLYLKLLVEQSKIKAVGPENANLYSSIGRRE